MVLTEIHGRLVYESLRKIKNEIKANAASAPCDLGGGNHVYLGLVIIPVEYANITPTTCIRPLHPGILNIPLEAPNYEATRLISDHKELIRLKMEKQIM